VPCQVGTASSQLAAPSATSCTPCGIGQYSKHAGSTTCNPVTVASPFVVGWVYVGLFAGFVLASGLIALIFQKKLRRPVLAAAVGTTLSLSLVLFQTITCDPATFTITFSAVSAESSGSLSSRPTICVIDVTLPSLTVTYTFPAPLSFTSASSVVFSATSANQSPLFSHGVSYNLSLSSYQGMSVQMWETLTNNPVNQLTGDVTVDLSAVPTEYLYDTATQSIGYTYTHFSSSAEVLNATTSSTYSVTFSVPVERYFYQIKNVQSTSDVVFLTSLFGLSGAVIAAGSLFANVISYLHRRWTDYSSGRGTSSSAANKDHLVPLFNLHLPWFLVGKDPKLPLHF